MEESTRARQISLIGIVLLVATTGLASKRLLAKRASAAALVAPADEDLHDSLASLPTLARVSGKPAAVSWFKSPQRHRAEVESALLSSRRRRSVGGVEPR